MCGIFGYIGKKNGVKIAIEGLKRLEYRGYDSAGLAGVSQGRIVCFKEVGKVHVLEQSVGDFVSDLVISHTRWATHGKVTKENAHPQFDAKGKIAVVLNGIIENYQALRSLLINEGVCFRTETDTEVIPNLIAKFYEGDFLKAVQQALVLLKGSYAIAVLHENHPDELICTANGSPLVVGVGVDEFFVSSDSNALSSHTKEVLFLSNGETAFMKKGKEVVIFDNSMTPISKKTEQLLHQVEEATKGSFEHYTLKEIFEQPQTIRNAMYARFFEEFGTVAFDDVSLSVNDLLHINNVLIVACGTSWHAGCVAAYMLEDLARLPTRVEISSEFRYKNPIVSEGTLVIAISQSGETADTLASVRELKAKGAYVLGICNVQGSTLTREANGTIFLRAGAEIGVCSTKAFTSQLVVLSLLTILLARMRNMSKGEGIRYLQALAKIPQQIQAVLDTAPRIEAIAKKYAQYDNFFYVGRRYMFPVALEGALKHKEIAYVNANGYAAGEMKHGPIALIDPNCPTVALAADKYIYEKLISNLMEIKARHGKIICIATTREGVENIADECIVIPETCDEFAPIVAAIPCQLLAYYIAKERGAEIDKPRNLAKSVTVE